MGSLNNQLIFSSAECWTILKLRGQRQLQGVPLNMRVAIRVESRLWSFHLFETFSRQHFYLKQYPNISPIPVNITGEIKNFDQISKFFISPAISKAQERQTPFWKCQDYWFIVIINSRIWLLKSGLRTDAINYFKDCYVSWDTLYI